ncbi:GNAT family N-acetyltransferase [Halobacteriovorax sp.]|uniref:GNAT family N-acetyltransferase n=1 Tax=Halobacteriovorax sp. TaxID=2020862 RepID=UPI0035615F0D
MQVKIYSSIDNIKESDWNQLIHPDDIFNKYHFHRALEVSECIGLERSQVPHYITVSEDSVLRAACVVYIKDHSYGEYIFDWAWADLYSRYGEDYYPKLIAQNPFTPATNRTFLYTDSKYIPELMSELQKLSESLGVSSKHLLFLDAKELPLLPFEYKTRASFQYHWKNKGYKDFEDFLTHLKSRKAKQIRKERKTDLEIREIPADKLTKYSATFFELYISTISKKNSYAYLNYEFFNYIFTHMKSSIRLIGAFHEEKLIAASLYFIGEKKLYGRYWGAREEFRNLHFELCYYQGIDMAIANKLDTFEAGAQGEHKISRGFEPTKTYSAHVIFDERFRAPIYNFISEEENQIDNLLPELSKRLPFKAD